MTAPITKSNTSTSVAAKRSTAKSLAGKQTSPEEKRRRYKIAAIAVGLGLLLVLVGRWWWMRPSAQLERVREMQRELASLPSGKGNDERKQKFEELRAEQKKLSEGEKQEARKEMGTQMRHKFDMEALAYLKMSQSEKTKLLDEKIARELDIQKKIDANAAKQTASGDGKSGNGPSPDGGGKGGGPRKASPEQRDEFRRDMLIHTSPEARAAMDQMRLDMAARRVQKGLPPQPTFGKGR